MTGWSLSDELGITYTFSAFTLASGGEDNVWVNVGADTATDLYRGSSSAIWTNSGDKATLNDTA